MKVWAISDTHGFHDGLNVPEVDMVVFGGDCSNVQSRAMNANEVIPFLKWFQNLPIKYKIFVAGNHDTSIEAGMVDPNHYLGVIWLDHEATVVEDKIIFGSPYSPTFGTGWAYNKDRGKLNSYWEQIPDHTHILITHTPPKGILDLSHDRLGNLEYCGCAALRRQVSIKKPAFHVFGHIHNSKEDVNQGTRIVDGITYINASCVTDGRFDVGATSNGVIFEV